MEIFTSTETIVRSSSNYVFNPINVELAECPYNDKLYNKARRSFIYYWAEFFLWTLMDGGGCFRIFFQIIFSCFFLFLFFHGLRWALQ